MKKIIMKLTFVIVSLLVILVAFTSCSEQQKATRVLNDLNETMKSADSFSISGDMRIEGKSNGYFLTFTQLTSEYIVGKNGVSSPEGLITTIYNYDFSLDSLDSETVFMQGYNDEYLFRYVNTSDTEIKLKSPVTDEGIDGFIDPLFEETLIDKESLSYLKEDDGTQIVRISNLSGAAIEKNLMVIGSVTSGYNVISANVTITVNPDFSVWTSVVDYVFEDANPEAGNNYTPSAKSVTTFSDFGSTTVPETYLDDYTECDDVSIISKVSNELNERLLMPYGSAKITSKISFSYKNVHYNNTMKTYISYGTDEDGFFYDVITSGEETKKTSYSCGLRDDGQYTNVSSDSVERMNIYNLLTLGMYNELSIYDVTQSESNPDFYTLKPYLSEDNPDYKDIESYKILVTYKDGYLYTMEIVIRGYGYVGGEWVYQNINYEIKYSTPEE